MTNCDELFEREELSAASDVGWPDCFNSGVFVFTPSQETFRALLQLASETGSFDGKLLLMLSSMSFPESLWRSMIWRMRVFLL